MMPHGIISFVKKRLRDLGRPKIRNIDLTY
jgi:hypothetical protein